MRCLEVARALRTDLALCPLRRAVRIAGSPTPSRSGVWRAPPWGSHWEPPVQASSATMIELWDVVGHCGVRHSPGYPDLCSTGLRCCRSGHRDSRVTAASAFRREFVGSLCCTVQLYLKLSVRLPIPICGPLKDRECGLGGGGGREALFEVRAVCPAMGVLAVGCPER